MGVLYIYHYNTEYFYKENQIKICFFKDDENIEVMNTVTNTSTITQGTEISRRSLSLSQHENSLTAIDVPHHSLMEFFEVCAGLIGSLAR
jgi:hypothetical protein